MPGEERDSTQDWLLPGHRLPPTIAELEGRIDEALATARATEAAVMTVGAAALDAAEQARRAAELAERAASSAAGVDVEPHRDRVEPTPPPREEPGDDSMRDFSERADRLVERLQQIQRLPLDRAAAQQHTRSHSTR
ncbi:MAG TPA: hypothetical protein VNO20_02465 [Solirubrobacterales bacterium]|nr:hypothetical protein [Solirubrobacterales bacterium]